MKEKIFNVKVVLDDNDNFIVSDASDMEPMTFPAALVRAWFNDTEQESDQYTHTFNNGVVIFATWCSDSGTWVVFNPKTNHRQYISQFEWGLCASML